MNRAIKYRIYPTEEQQVLFAKTFGCCRKVWNLMLDEKGDGVSEGRQVLQADAGEIQEGIPLSERSGLACAG